jgi:exosortase
MLTGELPRYSATQSNRSGQFRLRVPLLFIVLGILLVVCYFSVLRVTAQFILFGEDMAHGMFAPLVALYLAWERRDVLLHQRGAPSFWSLPALGLAACIAVVATLANSSTFSRVALLVSLAGCLLLIGGWVALRRLLFPLSLLLFTFPIPAVLYGEITQPLQLLATRLSEFSLETLGFSVFREGNILQLAHMQLSVVEACSGLRSLITLFFFCLVYTTLFETRLWLRVVVTLAAVPAAILVNTLRITATGVIGKFRLDWTVGLYHSMLGWTAFFLGFFLVVLLHRIFQRLAESPVLRVSR